MDRSPVTKLTCKDNKSRVCLHEKGKRMKGKGKGEREKDVAAASQLCEDTNYSILKDFPR